MSSPNNTQRDLFMVEFTQPETRVCNKCDTSKPISDFAIRAETGRPRKECNACRAERERQRRLVHGGFIYAKDKERYWSNPERRQKNRDRLKQRYAELISDPELHEKEKARNRERAKRFVEKWRALVARRRAALIRATPPWVDAEHQQMIDDAYALAKARTRTTREVWNVDHIVPLQNPIVCGLHVWWNLRVVPEKENRSKGNRLEDKP